MVYLRHGFLVRLLEEIRYKHTSSRINYFTGHGGDTLFDVFSTGAKDIDDCVRRILFKQGLFSFREIIALTNIEERELRAEIKKILSLFPEEKPAEKMKHFVFFEESLRFSYEIEDLNRFYFWSVCPFYSVPFFKYIINCSDESKARLALYREFLQAISPEAAAISNSDWGCPITSMKFKIFQHMLYFLMKHKTVRKLLRKATNKGAHSKAHNYQRNSPTIRCLSEQVSNCDAISNYLSLMTMKKILNNSTHYTYTAIDNLLTITSLLEESLCSRSAINKYF